MDFPLNAILLQGLQQKKVAEVLLTILKKDLLALHCEDAGLSSATFYDTLAKFLKCS